MFSVFCFPFSEFYSLFISSQEFSFPKIMTEEVKPLFQSGIPPYSPRRRNSLGHSTGRNSYAHNGSSSSLSTPNNPAHGFSSPNVSHLNCQQNIDGGGSSLPHLFYLHQNQGSRSSLHSGNAFNHTVETVEHHATPQIPTVEFQPSQFFQLVPFFNGDSDSSSSMALVPVSQENVRRSLDGGTRPHSWAVSNSNDSSINTYKQATGNYGTYHSTMRERPQSMDPRWAASRSFDHERTFDLEDSLAHRTPKRESPSTRGTSAKFEPPRERDWELPNSKRKRSLLKRVKHKIKKIFGKERSSDIKEENPESKRISSFLSPTELEKPPNRDLNSNSETALHQMYRPASRYRSKIFEAFPEE